ncbi:MULTISPECIES: hypothetical protein [Bacillaceae]|uniref:hypothetical protein n=1 Tax=Bacillaceae TaxID=186817 RepID=UPI000552EDF9|nr:MULTISPECIES: hypothetical protein [Bacillaceae]UOE92144.1 hypothetical protein MM271_12815 [Alkalihalobacillus sp. LMS39]
MAVNVLFNGINVGQFQSGSGIFFGTNNATGWNSPQKLNQIIASNGQGNIISGNLGIVNDPDGVDNPSADPDIQPSLQNQVL